MTIAFYEQKKVKRVVVDDVSFLHNVCSDYAYDANVRAALFFFAFSRF